MERNKIDPKSLSELDLHKMHTKTIMNIESLGEQIQNEQNNLKLLQSEMMRRQKEEQLKKYKEISNKKEKAVTETVEKNTVEKKRK